MKESIKNLLKIKSIITLCFTFVFAIMLIVNLFNPIVIPQEFIMLYTTIVGFYFGTQSTKKAEDKNDNNSSL